MAKVQITSEKPTSFGGNLYLFPCFVPLYRNTLHIIIYKTLYKLHPWILKNIIMHRIIWRYQ